MSTDPDRGALPPIRNEAGLLCRCESEWFCRAGKLATIIEAQAARITALEAAARAVVNAQSGSTWTVISLLADVLAAGADADPESKRLRTPEDNIAFWRSDEAMSYD